MPSQPICLKVLLSYHRIWSPIKLGSKAPPSHFRIRPQQQSQGPLHKDKDIRLK